MSPIDRQPLKEPPPDIRLQKYQYCERCRKETIHELIEGEFRCLDCARRYCPHGGYA
jgi:hypothetical protein